MIQSSIARITRACSAFVLGIHASTLQSVAAAAVRREDAAWARRRAIRLEIQELRRLEDLQVVDAVAAAAAANHTAEAVAIEIESLPFINK